jgi:WD40 repeat protein/tRNA A-37 threonylcarbamoyl transferase component Bud32
MPDSTDRRSLSELTPATSLDDVLAFCLTIMERGEPFDRARMLGLYPQWSDELEEFFSNWDAMERYSSQMSDCRRQLRAQTLPGTQVRYFGDYELLEEIGQGGMGIIYKARQIKLDRIVALKMILDRRHDRERFRLEAELAASLEHPNIVSIYEVGEFEGHPYFTMQFVEGKNLSELLAAGPLQAKAAAELTAQLAVAVHYAHQRGVLHRDLKPANVLLDAAGTPHVTDFGLAKQIECDDRLGSITETGAILGTPSYMSPEQAGGQRDRLTVATDIYGLGAILYTLLTGRPPFSGSSSLDVLRKVMDQPPTAPRDGRPAVPRDLETICLKCLEKKPSARYDSAAALADDLRRFLRHEPIEARPVGALGRSWRWCRRNPTTAALLMSIAAVLVGTSIVTTTMARREHLAWLTAEAGRRREEGLRWQIAKAMEAETTARHQAVATLVDSFATNGLLADEQGDPSTALLWFQHAYGMSGAFPERRRHSEARYRSWYAHSPRPVHVLQLEDPLLSDLEFDATGRYLLCQSQAGAVIWDLEQEVTIPMTRTSRFQWARWHPQREWLAVSDDTGRVTLLDVKQDIEVWSRQFDQVADSLAFSADGVHLAIAHGSELTVWSHLPDSPQHVTASHPARVMHVEFDGPAQRVLAACADDKVRLYNRHDDRLELLHDTIPCLTSGGDKPLSLPPGFATNGKHLFTLVASRVTSRPDERVVEVYEAATARRRSWRMIGVSQLIELSPKRHRFLNVGDDYSRVTELTMRAHPERLPHRGRIAAAGFSLDGRLIATGGSDRLVRIWRADRSPFPDVVLNASRPCAYVIPHQQPVIQLAWSNHLQIATAQADGLVRIWQLPEPAPYASAADVGSTLMARASAPPSDEDAPANRAPNGQPPAAAGAEVARLSPDGSGTVLDCRDSQARVLRWLDGRLNSFELAHHGRVLDGIFTTDDQYILTLGSEGLVKVWYAASGQLAVRPFEVSDACERIGVSNDAQSALLRRDGAVVQVIDLGLPQPRSNQAKADDMADDMGRHQLFAELVSGKRLHSGGLVNLTTQQWLDRWHRWQPLP